MNSRLYYRTYTFCVPEHADASRIDMFIAQQLPNYSRSYFKRLFDDTHIKINGVGVHKAGTLIRTNDLITVIFPLIKTDIPAPIPDNIKVDIIHKNDQFMIVNKPAGLVVHKPNTHSTEFTLVDWLIHAHTAIKDVGSPERPGIVHRLDKNTSGLMIIPLTNYAHGQFADQFKNRTIHKTYTALVHGHPDKSGTIDYPITRDPIHKHKMTHRSNTSRARNALTNFTVEAYGPAHALIKAKPQTGRTHQIRVHLSAIGHPIVGDSIYGKSDDQIITRHALHAQSLEFDFDGKHYQFTANIPEDMQRAKKIIIDA